MTVHVPEDKLSEIVSLVELWLLMHTATIKDLQSLLGKLLYVRACIRPVYIYILYVAYAAFTQCSSFKLQSRFISDHIRFL